MDDVAGCRLIFKDIVSLYDFRKSLHQAHFKHELRNEVDKYDYIKAPKIDGYRGIHDVYKYDVNSIHGRQYKGLQIELQYRTVFQHAWATAVEIVGFITTSNPKFHQGDDRYLRCLSLASEIIARVYEGHTSCHSDLSDGDLCTAFSELEQEIGLMNMLRTLNSTEQTVSARNTNLILIFSDDAPLEIRTYRDAVEALQNLFLLEDEKPHSDVVLVRGSRHDVRNAFKNYFTDAVDFINYVDRGVVELTLRETDRRSSVPGFDLPVKISHEEFILGSPLNPM
jgi:hypothetical protein